MLKALEAELRARRQVVAGTPVLRRTASRLETLLTDLTTAPLYLPEQKALLSRDGGVCPNDGARLAFHPYEPDRHRCPRCSSWWEGPRHHRAWITRYHLWLSERAVHLALLSALLDRPAHGARAADILAGYAARYHSYPNRDNVLGPTRPFFSTYLESIWLIQLCTAALLLDAGTPRALRERDAVAAMVEESAGLIASFDEGWSNRQVWNAAALIAAGAWLARDDLVAAGADGPASLSALLEAVDADGWWHEGENYHLFATRGFVLGAELLRWLGQDPYTDTPLERMFAAPLETLWPDLTLPARGDAPYGVSVRQPRFAELWETGRARVADPRLDAVLAALYDAAVPELEDAGLGELAEQEQNRPGHRIHRDRLGWKALLWMRPDDPRPGGLPHTSVRLDEQGVVVLRGDGRAAMVECGRRAGGHGHPDRLHLSLFWNRPVLADFGTAAYVHPSLHWYRSALAHNVPARAGAGQWSPLADCEAAVLAGAWQACLVRGGQTVGPGSTVRRVVALGPDLALDLVLVEADPAIVVDLPLHPLAGAALPAEPTEVTWAARGAGHETGYDAAELLGAVRDVSAPVPVGDGLALTLVPRAGGTVLLARAPGPPGADFADGAPLTFLVRRAAGSGRWLQLVTPADGSARVTETAEGFDLAWGERRARLTIATDAVTIVPTGDAPIRLPFAPIAVDLPEQAPGPAPAAIRLPPAVREPSLDAWPEGAARFDLGERHYRRSEVPYDATESLRARVELVTWGHELCFRFQVAKRDLVVRPGDAPDPALDNEPADIHSDGVQVYVGRDGVAGYLLVPEPERGTLRVRPVAGTAGHPGGARGAFRRTPGGYELLVRCDTGARLQRGDRVRFTAVVNEMRAGRERRAGQLALAGGGWVYLRGDREYDMSVGEVV